MYRPINLGTAKGIGLFDSNLNLLNALLYRPFGPAFGPHPPGDKSHGSRQRLLSRVYPALFIARAFMPGADGNPDPFDFFIGLTMRISLICTVKNEGDSLRRLLDSLTRQTLRPDELIVSDGGSTDHTIAILQSYRDRLPITIVPAPGSNISQGRNIAIAAATGEIIAATDAGVVLQPEWLAAITRPLREGRAAVVSGWFEPDPATPFEVVMGATVLPALEDIDPDSFLPSSRSVAFLRTAWEAVGGYPEWLDFSEDLVFDLALRERYAPFAFAPEAIAHFRPRGSLKAFARQYRLYARGDGKADLWRKRHAVRYLTYLAGLPLLAGWGIIGRNAPLLSLFALLTGVAAYCRRPWQRLRPAIAGRPLAAQARAFALVPVIRLVGDVAKMVGYPAGVWWRLTRNPPSRQQ
jgi:glycosyltransferase involved in cell wall biosynthesis